MDVLYTMYLVQKTKLRRQILHTSTLCTYVFKLSSNFDMQDYQVSGLQKGE